ncbi:unnamed protein product [Litomosoides sigmodontis]|uniref:Uncharacterized protein n=1 Tax=Litomosoides sigmodontis TaxID=42156 RepID=A0A3P6SAK8_LITSI|nr:unnamed protein product [Litomosoides sigmodontis]
MSILFSDTSTINHYAEFLRFVGMLKLIRKHENPGTPKDTVTSALEQKTMPNVGIVITHSNLLCCGFSGKIMFALVTEQSCALQS